MPEPDLDIGAILGRVAEQLPGGLGVLTAAQRRAVADLSACRTARLGGRVEQCSCCGRREYRYNSCRNRHCPKCQGGERAAWLDREASYLLPVEYHHLVFTLPRPVARLARHNPRLIYGLLFAAASASVQEVAADPKHLGAQVGLTAVLHTWGQTLSLHPHLHVLATGGGLSCDARGRIDERPVWRSCRPGFFLPVRVLCALFRGKFLAGLSAAYRHGDLRLAGVQASLSFPRAWAAWLGPLRQQAWVVYSRPPTAGAEVVLKYLARYTYRVALSNRRRVQVGDGEATFTYEDYRQHGQNKEMTLSAAAFARRFLQHVLPVGFVRVRHYGLLANRGREAKLGQCRRLLLPAGLQRPVAVAVEAYRPGAEGPRLCPACGRGWMEVVEVLAAWPRPGRGPRSDSS
jgi:hypothetical protein